MPDHPRISVIITTYNRAHLVPLAIESVLVQTVPAHEIIVVDDGSTDNTGAVLAKYKDQISVLRQDNKGVSYARNIGVSAASGEWIAFLDDDDEYTPNRLERVSAIINRYPETPVHATNLSVVMGEITVGDLFMMKGLGKRDEPALVRPLQHALAGNFFVQSLTVRRTVLVQSGLFRHMLFEDLDLIVRLSELTPWSIDWECGIRLIRRDAALPNLSSQWRSKPVQRAEALVKLHSDALGKDTFTRDENQRLATGLGNASFELAIALWSERRFAEARRHFYSAAKAYPSFRSKVKSIFATLGGYPVIRSLKTLSGRHPTLLR